MQKLKAEEIEGLRELISQVILEERDKLVPVSLLQDVEEVRRSPAGAVIRMEGKIDRLEEGLADLREEVKGLAERMATKEELASLEQVMNGRFTGMQTEMNARFTGMQTEMNVHFTGMQTEMNARFGEMGERVDSLEQVMNARFTGMQTEMNARFEGVEQRFAGIEKRLGMYDFWLKLFGGVITALLIAQLVLTFVR